MTTQKYVVIQNSDGETSVSFYTKEQLLEHLNNDYWGSTPQFFTSPPKEDPDYWGEDGLLILKAGVVVPVPKKVVESFDIE